jgi:hypothetical protein
MRHLCVTCVYPLAGATRRAPTRRTAAPPYAIGPLPMHVTTALANTVTWPDDLTRATASPRPSRGYKSPRSSPCAPERRRPRHCGLYHGACSSAPHHHCLSTPSPLSTHQHNLLSPELPHVVAEHAEFGGEVDVLPLPHRRPSPETSLPSNPPSVGPW